MHSYDLVIVTQDIFMVSESNDPFVQNVLLEDELIIAAFEKAGLNVCRMNWDRPDFDWASTKAVLFRATWDYFNRFKEFDQWLMSIKDKTLLINPYDQILWNIDKHYLKELEQQGINTVETIYIEPGETKTITEIMKESGWKEAILKPAISGGARHTYRLNLENVEEHQEVFEQLIREESMMLQPFLNNILKKGEVSYMVFGGKFSHAVLKIAKPGDFRVQDDFGGSVHHYTPNAEEIAFAENCALKCSPTPIYARIDIALDNSNALALIEMEMIEPELWFRMNDQSAQILTEAILKELNKLPL